MIPPRSPHSLIQEDLWPDRWLILVSCMMLNCTRRKQVEKIFPTFVKFWPTPQAMVNADVEQVANVIRSLGFGDRRAASLIKMSESFVKNNWSCASELPGIGSYASRAYQIFCENKLGDEAPEDGALLKYYCWRKAHEQQQT